MFGRPGSLHDATTGLIPSRVHLFLTAAKPDGEEGHTFCARTTDGGRTLAFLSWIGPEPAGYTIMPASVRPTPSCILVAVRCQEGRSAENWQSARNWIDLYQSTTMAKHGGT